MSKKIKTTNSNLDIFEGNIEFIDINEICFEKDWRYPWVDIYSIEKQGKKFIEKVEEDDDSPIIDSEDLRVFAFNWYFNNVEIVKELDIKEV